MHFTNLYQVYFDAKPVAQRIKGMTLLDYGPCKRPPFGYDAASDALVDDVLQPDIRRVMERRLLKELDKRDVKRLLKVKPVLGLQVCVCACVFVFVCVSVMSVCPRAFISPQATASVGRSVLSLCCANSGD